MGENLPERGIYEDKEKVFMKSDWKGIKFVHTNNKEYFVVRKYEGKKVMKRRIVRKSDDWR